MKKVILICTIVSVGFTSYAQKSKKQVVKPAAAEVKSGVESDIQSAPIPNAKDIENGSVAAPMPPQIISATDAYLTTMKGLITKLFATNDIDGIESTGNYFERISMTETSEWLPSYYAAYAKIMTAFMSKDLGGIDAKVDDAEKLIQKAEAINPNSELECLKGMCHQARIMADPMTRGQRYSQMAKESFNVSSELDPTNPRPLYMKAQSAFYTPEQFGGGKKIAKNLFELAIQKFEKFKPSNDIMPNWGYEDAKTKLAECSK
jgi:hypothetical protein